MWFDIIGATLGFLGSVVFSAALLKPKEQILDENNSYWDGNPFTTAEGLNSQPYFLIAFILLVTGFAVSLGGKLGIEFGKSNLLVSILFCVSIALAGYLATALFYIQRIISHQNRKIQWLKGIFINAARSYANQMAAIEGQENEKKEFERIKPTLQKDLLEKYKQIPEPADKREHLLIQATDSANSPRKFREAIEKYLAATVE